jgi:hypothetical protein
MQITHWGIVVHPCTISTQAIGDGIKNAIKIHLINHFPCEIAVALYLLEGVQWLF